MKKLLLILSLIALVIYPLFSQQTKDTLPYKEEEVKIHNGDIILAGTLSLPLTKGPHPAMVMITGSGSQNRDEEIFGFKPFRIIADYLTRRGIAVLRCDDRGVGGSSRGSDTVTTLDFAEDAYQGLKYLQTRNDINPKLIGLYGHSEGGLAAPIEASRHDDIAFIILMAGTAVTGEKIIMAQLELLMRADSAKENDIQKALQQEKKVFDCLKSGKGWENIEKELIDDKIEELKKVPPEKLKGITNIEKFAAAQVKRSLATVKSNWFRFFTSYDPANALEKVKCPVLALFGELDLQVPVEMNKQALEKSLTKGGNKDYEIKVFPKANHLFESAITGSVSEYAKLKKEFVPGFLETIADWLNRRTVLQK